MHGIRYAQFLSHGWALAGALLLGGAGCHPRGEARIEVVSSRPDTVTGGDALVRVVIAPGVDPREVRVTVNGIDVTGSFVPSIGAPNTMTGMVTGLTAGRNVIATDGGARTELVVTSYPIVGPVFSGPHEQPFFCETDTFQLPDGSTLGPALDANCSIARRVDYFYRSTAPATPDQPFKRLPSPQSRPADLAMTTTTAGIAVPYIVRIETGTINRSIYQTSVLHTPGDEAEPDPFTRPSGWNGRLVYTFGGGCINGWYRQGNTTGGVLDDNILKQGYAMASASLNVFGNDCQEVSSAETMMMVKERFIEAYGVPVHTIGWGCSGGSYQQHQIADDYPGLLDGILPGCSFPEVGFATIQFITDARLLNHYFKDVAPGRFTPEAQRQVTGFLRLETMANVSVGAGRISPFEFCPSFIPADRRYDPLKNPTGVRCDVYDHTVNIYGRDPATGFARRPLDNVGIQYGLAALNDAAITVEQFLDLNEHIGGYDQDAGYVPRRTEGDLEAIRAAYRSGRVTNGGLGLRTTPMIDYRAYNDDAAGGDIHLRYHSFSMRERLRKANGNSDNQIMLVEDQRYGLYGSVSPMLLGALRQMDQWLDAIARDAGPEPGKIARNKPNTLLEGCNTRDASPTFIAETQTRGHGRCEALYPSNGAPREVAGASVASDIIKCRLRPIAWSDYAVPFAPEQKAKLESIFPSGVCDWNAQGIEQQAPSGVWQRF